MAIDDHDRALRLDPNYARACHNQGLAYEATGEVGRAMSDRETVISLSGAPMVKWWREYQTNTGRYSGAVDGINDPDIRAGLETCGRDRACWAKVLARLWRTASPIFQAAWNTQWSCKTAVHERSRFSALAHRVTTAPGSHQVRLRTESGITVAPVCLAGSAGTRRAMAALRRPVALRWLCEARGG